MKDPSMTKQELIEEIYILKQRIQELEKADAERKRMNDVLRESEGRVPQLKMLGQTNMSILVDIVMQRAKEQGRNNYQFYSAPALHR